MNIIIYTGINSRDKELFSFLQDQKAAIEKQLGAELEWVDAAKASRIKIRKSNFNLQSQSGYESDFQWLHLMIRKFKEGFVPFLDEFGK